MNKPTSGTAPQPPTPAKPPELQPARAIDSQSLFGAARQLLIVHQGETYKLQITRQGKLILTK
jgi:hemin uptake protein HemP